MDAPRFDQIAGCLLGQSLADALGLCVRGLSADDARRCADEIIAPWFAGEPLPQSVDCLFLTEGSQLSWELILVCTERQEFDPQAFAQRIRQKFDQRSINARNWDTYMAVKNLRSGRPWYESGVDSRGCSSVQRAPAVAALFWGDERQRRIAAEQQSRITHQSGIAEAGSVLVTELVADLLNQNCGPHTESLSLAVPQQDPGLESVLRKLADLVDLEPHAALRQILSESGGSDGIADDVAEALLWALDCALRCRWDYRQAVLMALSCGGEAVAPVALVGAMCGAAQGLAALPPLLLERISDRGIVAEDQFLHWSQRGYDFSRSRRTSERPAS